MQLPEVVLSKYLDKDWGESVETFAIHNKLILDILDRVHFLIERDIEAVNDRQLEEDWVQTGFKLGQPPNLFESQFHHDEVQEKI